MTAALLSSFTPPPSFSVVATMSNDDTTPTTGAHAPTTSRAAKHQSLPSSSSSSSTMPKNYSISLPESSSHVQQPLSHHGKVKKTSRSDKGSSKEHVGNQFIYSIIIIHSYHFNSFLRHNLAKFSRPIWKRFLLLW